MTFYRSINLRLWLPLIILAGLVLLVGLLSLARYHLQTQRMETYLEGQLRYELNRNQRLIEGLLRIREYGLVAEEIAELGAAPDIRYAMLIDDTGLVRFASERLWLGRAANDVLPEHQLTSVGVARLDYRLILTLNESRNTLQAFQAIRLEEDGGEILSQRNGVLVLEYDLSGMYARLQRILWQDLWTSLGIGTIIILLLFLLLHRYLAQPLNYLGQLVNRISQGHFDTDIRILGDGELVHLGRSIGHMQAQLIRMNNEQAQAREELAQFKNTLDQTLDGVIIASTDGFRFLYVNQGIQRQLGYSEAELLTMTPLDIKPDDDTGQLSERMEPLLSGQVDSLSFESLHQRKDGHVFPVEIFLQLIHQDGSRSRFVAIVRDISARKNTEALLNDQMAVLEMIAQGEPLERVLSELIAAVETQAPEMFCSILLLDESGQHLHDCVAPRLPDDYRRAIDGSAIGPAAGSCGTAAFRAEPVVVSDIAHDPLWKNYAELALAHNLRACWSTPIFSATHSVLGTFAVYYRVPTEPDITHQKFIAMATHTAAIAIERQRAEVALRDSVEYTHIIFDNVADGIVTISAQGVVESCNNSAALMFDYRADEIVGKHISQLIPESHAAQHDMYLENIRQGSVLRAVGKGRDMEAQRKGGQVFPVHLSVSHIVHHGQEKFIGLLSDISDRRRNEEKIQRLAFYDPLTELPNRRLLIDRLQQALVACTRNGKQGALLLLDLDNFKDLNDTLGHDAGDQLLCQVAQRLLTCVREGDTVARLGGDEFVIVLEGLHADIQEAAATAKKTGEMVLALLRQSYRLGSSEYFSSPSIGITLFSKQLETVDALLKRADVAMYQAKSAGRNTLQFFDSALQASLEARTALEADMRVGLHQQQFFLYYQPQVDGSGRVFGAEALLRWQHPVRGMVSPAEFIPLAEQSGFILQLGHWVLRTACDQLVVWESDPLTAELSLAINVSARQFRQLGFVEQVLGVVRETGARPQHIKLELTESLLVSNIDDVIEKMRALKDYGVGFSLDDFGTGYSSLSYLRQLPLDQLKIDQSFVRDVLVDQNDAVIAQTIIGLGVSLGLDVIAEGVELEGQREFLATHGCNAYQGYLFSRPVPAAEFEAFLRP